MPNCDGGALVAMGSKISAEAVAVVLVMFRKTIVEIMGSRLVGEGMVLVNNGYTWPCPDVSSWVWTWPVVSGVMVGVGNTWTTLQETVVVKTEIVVSKTGPSTMRVPCQQNE